jgi:hypothetical protein
MNRIFIIILLFISLIFYGCSPPPISVLYLTDLKYSDYIIQIDNSAYYLVFEYDLDKFSERIQDSLITYSEVEIISGNEYTFNKIIFSDSLLIGYNNLIDSIKISQIKFVRLFRASTSDEKSQGWLQVFGWSLIGFLFDVGIKEEEENLGYKGTAIGGIVGVSLGSLFFFDNNKPYEDIYFKQ